MASEPEHVGQEAERALLSLDARLRLPGPEFAPGSERLSWMGGIPVARAAWGTYLPSEGIFEALGREGVLDEGTQDRIKGLGFAGGFRFPSQGVDVYSDEVQGYMAGYAARLAGRVVGARRSRGENDWDHVDRLYVGSSTATEGMIEQVGRLLSSIGVGVDEVVHYSLACNSATQALRDAHTLPGKNVVIVGLDTLSGSVAGTDDPVTYATFGNGGGALALVPGKDMRLVGDEGGAFGGTVIEHDTEPILTVKTGRGLPEGFVSTVQPPEGYRLKGVETAAHFAVTPDGVFLTIPQSEDGRLHMNPVGTYRYFVLLGAVEYAYQTAKAYAQSEFGRSHPLGYPTGHQPSYEVLIGGFNQMLARLALESLGWDRARIRGTLKANIDGLDVFLEAHGVVVPQFRWTMKVAGKNNTSAGTPLDCMGVMAQMGNFRPGSVHLLLGLGVGNSYGAHIIQIGPFS
ncbi:MAG: hypothetical protein HYS86_01960 [Candidatus Chisholmbacteria bacterium]|nr:hypothetical protein [Candidatus Chisholmbacteria bacterium]